MSTPVKTVVLLCVAAAAFMAGMRYSRPSASPGGRRILYYHDPMHPAYKSDKPGIAPDCGMQLEPVYADGGPADPAPSGPSFKPGTVQVSADRQQAIGVRTEEVRRAPASHTFRVLGRVAAEESRVYKLISPSGGWAGELGNTTTGSLVEKGQTLGVMYTPDLVAAAQAYIYAIDLTAAGIRSPSADTRSETLKTYVAKLRSLGMEAGQIDELAKTRKIPEEIRITSPVKGLVLLRNLSPGQRFEQGTEWFRIADLSQVWVLADLFENEGRLIQSAGAATVRYQGQVFQARMGDVKPIFDPDSRTLKVRFVVDNPNAILRPDMFVNVEFQAGVPAAVTVPGEAVLDSGLRKTVFVDRGNGFFEPRAVETGVRLGDRVVIASGLEPGERIVVSGNFLIDSESRFQLGALGQAAAMEKSTSDPVCGMDVDPAKTQYKSVYQGKTFYFCSDSCKRKFDAAPKQYLPGSDDAHKRGAM